MKRREFLISAGVFAFAGFAARAADKKMSDRPLAALGNEPVKVYFTGTGGADWAGKAKTGGETRANAGVFLQNSVLIDLTPSSAKNLPAGAAPKAVFYTHSHPDHYFPKELGKYKTIERVYAHEGWAEKAEKDIRAVFKSKSRPEVIPVKVGEVYEEQGMAFMPLKANHYTGLKNEQCLIYSVRTKKSHLLYATDTSGLMAETVAMIKVPLTGLVMNAMVGVGRFAKGRLFSHSTPEQVVKTVEALKAIGKYKAPGNRPVWTTHLSYTMNGTQDETEKEYPAGVVPAYDKLEVTI